MSPTVKICWIFILINPDFKTCNFCGLIASRVGTFPLESFYRITCWVQKITRFCALSRVDGASCWLALGNNGDFNLCLLGHFARCGAGRLPPFAMRAHFISVQTLHLITADWHCTTGTKAHNNTHAKTTWACGVLLFFDTSLIWLINFLLSRI